MGELETLIPYSAKPSLYLCVCESFIAVLRVILRKWTGQEEVLAKSWVGQQGHGVATESICGAVLDLQTLQVGTPVAATPEKAGCDLGSETLAVLWLDGVSWLWLKNSRLFLFWVNYRSCFFFTWRLLEILATVLFYPNIFMVRNTIGKSCSCLQGGIKFNREQIETIYRAPDAI